METNAVKDDLWVEMVLYHQDRIQHEYAPNLRAAFKREDNTTHSKSMIGNHSISANGLSTLRKLVLNASATEHDKLVSCAYELRTRNTVEGWLQDSSVEVTEKLWVDQVCDHNQGVKT